MIERFLLKILVLIILTSCSNNEDKILVGHDFEKGDWLLVNVNYAEEKLDFIDDESILSKNKNGISLTNGCYCGGTTCDGFLKLYKDGKLILQHEYLTRSELYESSQIIDSYHSGTKSTVNEYLTRSF